MPPSIEVILNASSGTDEKTEARRVLAETFAASGIEAQIWLANSGAEVVELARRAAAGTAHTIVAGGGDGTVNTVAAAVIGAGKTLGVLPLGTLNHFAKDLGIPLELAAAARTIIAGQTVRVDVGEVNGQIFLNNSGLGLYPNIVHEREKKQRSGQGKWTAFFQAALTVLRRFPFLDVRLSIEGATVRSRTTFVLIGNNEYVTEGLSLGARACLDAGKLSLYMTHRVGRLGLLRLALLALFGSVRETKESLRSAPQKFGSRRVAGTCALQWMVKSGCWRLRYIIGCVPVRCAY